MGIFKKKKKQNDIELQNAAPVTKSEEVFIKSTEELNKTDGVVTIATVTEEALTPNNAPMPAPIDVEARHKLVVDSKKAKQKKKVKNTVASKKASTITSLIALVAIAIIGGFFYYIKNKDSIDTFKLKTINLELGTSIPTNVSEYVDKKDIDEMEYTLDTSEVDINVVGEYTYKVTYNNVTKTGTIVVADKTNPAVETHDLIITLNEEFKPEDFIDSCFDLSNCHYTFENEQILNSNAQAGDYDIYIVVTDDYNNLTRKKANLKVVENLESISCIKENNTIESSGYYYTQYFEIAYYDNNYLRHKIYNTFKFENEDKYYENKNRFLNREGYTFDDEQLLITNEPVYNVDTTKTLTDIENEFANQGYTCTR